jgi:hypothetical protein
MERNRLRMNPRLEGGALRQKSETGRTMRALKSMPRDADLHASLIQLPKFENRASAEAVSQSMIAHYEVRAKTLNDVHLVRESSTAALDRSRTFADTRLSTRAFPVRLKTLVKRLTTRAKWKRYLAARSRAQARALARDRLRAPQMHEWGRPQPEGQKSVGQTETPIVGKARVKAPARLSLMQNPKLTISFLNEIRRLGANHHLFVDLSGVRTVTPDAVAALLATINHTGIEHASIHGSLPRDVSARRVLNQSGFRENVKSEWRPVDEPAVHTPSGRVLRLSTYEGQAREGEVSGNKYNQELTDKLIRFAMKMLTGVPAYHQPSYRVFSEAMLNTLNHAFPPGTQRGGWWASAYHDQSRKRACFTFVDLGVGIFRSHRLTLLLKTRRKFTNLNNAAILRMLFRGDVRSSTGVQGRGNGVPAMYTLCKAGRIGNFVVISNDAMGEAEVERYTALDEPFGGSILYWEIGHDD